MDPEATLRLLRSTTDLHERRQAAYDLLFWLVMGGAEPVQTPYQPRHLLVDELKNVLAEALDRADDGDLLTWLATSQGATIVHTPQNEWGVVVLFEDTNAVTVPLNESLTEALHDVADQRAMRIAGAGR